MVLTSGIAARPGIAFSDSAQVKPYKFPGSKATHYEKHECGSGNLNDFSILLVVALNYSCLMNKIFNPMFILKSIPNF
jgi:hypothetical protein